MLSRTRIGLGLGLWLLLLASVAAAEPKRPVWPLGAQEAALREKTARWLQLDDDAARKRAQAWAADPKQDLPQAAQDLAGLAAVTDDARIHRLAEIVLTTLIDPVMKESDSRPDRAITAQGSLDKVNLRVRDAAFHLAMRYAVSGRADDAQAVKRILLRFAEVVPDWPLWDRKGQRRDQNDKSFHRQWDGCGLWGGWYHSDLEASYPVLRAYDLVYGTLSPAERSAIEKGLFRHQKQLIDKWQIAYGNMLGSRLLGMVRFGLVLQEPDTIHEVLEIYRQMVTIGFFPDGMYREVSPSYHTMPVGRMTSTLPALLAGYTDPPGYRPKSGERIENLDLVALYGRHHDRWWTAWDKLTLPPAAKSPTLRTLAVDDATANRGAWWTRNPPHTKARLLGTTGVAMLGAGGEKTPQQLYLLFADTHGHEHFDALHISWFAHGREVFSETDYRPLPDSGSSRQWQSSTAGHNTVVVDRRNQHGRFGGNQRKLTDDDKLFGMKTWRYRQRAVNKGNLLMFDHGWPQVQAMEAEAERSYAPTAALYRRTLALVDLGGGDAYLVDVFRVRGGSRHDYMLHGCLDETYEVHCDAETRPADGMLFDAIKLYARANVKPPFSFDFRYRDGLRTLSRVLAPTRRDGAGAEGVALYLGNAPAMRRMGEAGFVALSRHGGAELAEAGQDNTFVVVHEATGSGRSKIVSASLLPNESNDPEAVALQVVLTDGRRDTFLSTLGDGVILLQDGTRFRGRLACLRRQNGRTTAARIFDGRSLSSGDGAVRMGNLPSIEGTVLATRRVDNGDDADAVVLGRLPADVGELAGRTLFVQLDDRTDYVWAYRIEEAQVDGNRTVVRLEHDPGFEIRDGGRLTKMVYHPGWGFRSRARYRIAPTGQWEAAKSTPLDK